MSENKEAIKNWLNALANDDYVEADKQFPNVVKTNLNSLINNKKPAIVKQLSAEAENLAAASVELEKEAQPEAKKE